MPIRTSLVAITLALTLVLGGVSLAESGAPEGFDPDLWTEGKRAYNEVGGMGCSGCHGRFGANELGGAPVIRGDDIDVIRIHGAVQGMQAMVFLQAIITESEIEAIAHYLDYLGTMEPYVVTMRRGELSLANTTLPPSTHVQLILYNQDRGTCTWTVDGADVEGIAIDGRTMDALDWSTGEAGTYEAYCAEAPDTRLVLTIE